MPGSASIAGHRAAEVDASIDASASRSAGFTDRPYFCLTATTRAANQPVFRDGLQSAASRSDFWIRFTVGSAMVRLARSPAKVRNCNSGSAESYASASATMCSMSVAAVPSGRMSKELARIGRVHLPPGLGQPPYDVVLQRAVRRAEGVPVIARALDLLTDWQSIHVGESAGHILSPFAAGSPGGWRRLWPWRCPA